LIIDAQSKHAPGSVDWQLRRLPLTNAPADGVVGACGQGSPRRVIERAVADLICSEFNLVLLERTTRQKLKVIDD